MINCFNLNTVNISNSSFHNINYILDLLVIHLNRSTRAAPLCHNSNQESCSTGINNIFMSSPHITHTVVSYICYETSIIDLLILC